MIASLETVIAGQRQNRFKSKGEEKIANYLDLTKIRYQYEPAVIIESQARKPRIWYPDFYLPEFKTYIEYYGMAGNQKYDQGIRSKTQAYQKSGFDVIPFYPWMFAKDWNGYLKRELKRSVIRCYRSFAAKPYRTRPGRYSHRR
ncbi:MAG: hypothetical protein V2I56_19405 [Desulfobacteraceae bacterium]|jgi:DNA helicase-4|nr:hypothetical protein [Desulfobacteraceae bacterium]